MVPLFSLSLRFSVFVRSFSLFVKTYMSLSPPFFVVLQSIVIVVYNMVVCRRCYSMQSYNFVIFSLYSLLLLLLLCVLLCVFMCAYKHAVCFFLYLLRFSALVEFFSLQFYLQCVFFYVSFFWFVSMYCEYSTSMLYRLQYVVAIVRFCMYLYAYMCDSVLLFSIV